MLRCKVRTRTGKLDSNLSSITKPEAQQTRPFFMHPGVFVSGWIALGLLLGFQELVEISVGGWKIPFWAPLLGGALEYLLWGLIFLGMWRF
jgi:hypothetical protein